MSNPVAFAAVQSSLRAILLRCESKFEESYERARTGSHRLADRQRAAARRPLAQRRTRREGEPVAVALPAPGAQPGGGRRDPAVRGVLDPVKLGLEMLAYITVKLEKKGQMAAEEFGSAVNSWAEVTECYR